jgi:hypothetical protein
MDGKRKTPARLAVAAWEGRSILPPKGVGLGESEYSNFLLGQI